MSTLFGKLGAGLATVGVFISGLFGATPVTESPQIEPQAPQEETLGADTVLPVAGMTYYLAGTGISSSATSFTLTSLTITQNGKKISDTDLSDIFYITLEPGSRARQEIISCTTVVQNANDTATISGCTRGLSPVTPYTASTSLQFAHAGGSIAIFSNPPQLYNQVAIKDNDETITGLWDFPAPVAGTNPATKDYVLSVVTGGTIAIDSTIIGGVAGENFPQGSIVYLAPTDARWYKADADLKSTFADRQIGIAQSAGSTGSAVTSGILIYGIDDSTQSAMTPGSLLWLSSTAGATSSATTTQVLGTVVDATTLNFNPRVVQSAVYTPTTFTATSTFYSSINASTSAPISGFGLRASTTIYATAGTSTYSVPASLRYLEVELVGGGGGGGGYDSDGSPGYGTSGAGGGYVKKRYTKDDLGTTTITIFVGSAGGAGNSGGTGTDGSAGTWSRFMLSSTTGLFGYGGGAGKTGDGYSNAGGSATGGDINIVGLRSIMHSFGSSPQPIQRSSNPLGTGAWNPSIGTFLEQCTGYGGGGYGGYENDYTAASGCGGVVIITEYF